jgi:hypothetical protein
MRKWLDDVPQARWMPVCGLALIRESLHSTSTPRPPTQFRFFHERKLLTAFRAGVRYLDIFHFLRHVIKVFADAKEPRRLLRGAH